LDNARNRTAQKRFFWEPIMRPTKQDFLCGLLVWTLCLFAIALFAL
jgi:hypothetical protein